MNYLKQLLVGGPIALCAGVILLAVDLFSMFSYGYIVIGNVVVSCFTVFLGILLTIFARMGGDKTGAILAWAIMAVILWCYQLVQVLWMMVLYIPVYAWWMAPLFWCKYCTQ